MESSFCSLTVLAKPTCVAGNISEGVRPPYEFLLRRWSAFHLSLATQNSVVAFLNTFGVPSGTARTVKRGSRRPNVSERNFLDALS